MKKRMMIMLICVGILFGLIILYKAFTAIMIKKYMSSNASPTVTVSTQKVGYESWQPTLHSTGTIRAVKGVEVTTEIAGMVRDIPLKQGSYVNKGTLLLKLNDDSEVATLHALQASQELAKITYERDKAQFAISAISKATLDADFADLKSKIAQVEQQQAVIAKKNIQAPINGVLGICTLNPGQYLNPGDKIVTLQSLNPIYIDFYVPQQSIVNIAKGQTVQITADPFPGEVFTGKITTLNPIVDTDTRNVLVEALLNNPKQKLLPGMFTKVIVNIKKPTRFLTLPQTAVSFNPYGEIVYIVTEKGKDKNGKPHLVANQTFVTVGETRGDQISILKGIKSGDIIVTNGLLKLKNGSTVAINNKVQPSNNPSPKPIDE